MITQYSPAFAAPFGKIHATHLDMSVRHDKAGMRGMDWKFHAAGHRLSFTPVARRGDGWQRSVLLGDTFDSGFYIRLDTAARKIPHAIARAMLAVGVHVQELRAAYEVRDGAALRAIADTVAAALAPRR